MPVRATARASIVPTTQLARSLVDSLVLCDFGGLAKGDRKKQSANDEGKNQNVSNSFHGFPLNEQQVDLIVTNLSDKGLKVSWSEE